MSAEHSTARLAIGTVVVAVVLVAAAATRHLAEPMLMEREQRQAMQLINRLNPSTYDNLPYKDMLQLSAPAWFAIPQKIQVYRLRQGGHPTGVVLPSISAPGYNGPIRIAVSIDASGQVRSVSVLEHRETLGIGDAVTQKDWLAGLRQRSLENTVAGRWRLQSHGGDFDELSGATTSAHTVLTLVRDCLRLYAEQGEAWFGEPRP